MSDELTDDEKKRLADDAAQVLRPIAEKYELDTTTGMAALFEAFQSGVKFAVSESRKLEEEASDGGTTKDQGSN